MERETTNKMGTERVSKVMLTMGIPIILSMVLQACYNIVDSMFVARMPDSGGVEHLGEYAVNALTLAFPVQMLIVAFGIGTGVGVNALLANYLGQGDKERVAKTAGNGLMLGVLIYVCFVIFGLVGIKGYFASQTSDPLILSMGIQYLQICVFASLGIIGYTIFEKLLQSTGLTGYSTTAQVCGAVTNVVLDPIMIYGLAGCPRLGVVGAALATVIGQWVSFLLALSFHFLKNKEIKNGLQYFKLDKEIVRRIYAIGLPAIIMQALMSVMTYGVNIIFGSVSTAAVTAYGIFYKIQQFIFFAGFGLRDAITPIVAFNYGMGSQKRVREGIRYGILYTEIVMIAGILLLELFAAPLTSIFGLSDTTAKLCILAMRIIATGFLFAGGNIALQGVFQALGCGISSLVVSILRLAVPVLPLAWLFSTWTNSTFWIWWAFPISEGIAVLAALYCLRRASRDIVSKI